MSRFADTAKVADTCTRPLSLSTFIQFHHLHRGPIESATKGSPPLLMDGRIHRASNHKRLEQTSTFRSLSLASIAGVLLLAWYTVVHHGTYTYSQSTQRIELFWHESTHAEHNNQEQCIGCLWISSSRFEYLSRWDRGDLDSGTSSLLGAHFLRPLVFLEDMRRRRFLSGFPMMDFHPETWNAN